MRPLPRRGGVALMDQPLRGSAGAIAFGEGEGDAVASPAHAHRAAVRPRLGLLGAGLAERLAVAAVPVAAIWLLVLLVTG